MKRLELCAVLFMAVCVGWQTWDRFKPARHNPPQPVPDQARLDKEELAILATFLKEGEGGWTARSNILADERGCVWLKADAEVVSKRPREDRDWFVRVERLAKGIKLSMPHRPVRQEKIRPWMDRSELLPVVLLIHEVN